MRRENTKSRCHGADGEKLTEVSLELVKAGQDEWWTNPDSAEMTEKRLLMWVLPCIRKKKGPDLCGAVPYRFPRTRVLRRAGKRRNLLCGRVLGSGGIPPIFLRERSFPASAEALDQQLVDAVSSYHYVKIRFAQAENGETDITATLEAYNNPNEEPPETVVERYGNHFRVKQHMINYRPWARFEIIKVDEAEESRRLNGAEFNTYALGESVEEAAANLVTRPSDNAVVPSPDTLVGTRVSHTTEDGVQGPFLYQQLLYGGIYLIKEMEPPLAMR